jgi:hypothetical protein
MTDHLRLVVNEGKPTIPPGFNEIVASLIAVADDIESGKIEMEHAVLVAVVDGAVTYAPIGTVTLVEATGLLELASRKIERDMMR